MRKLNKFLIVITLCAVLLSSIAVYAYINYFNTTKSITSAKVDNSQFNVADYIEIDSFEQLVRYSSYNETTSNSNIESNATPKYYKLTGNIIFSNDLVIYRDINIDLNHFNINLNGYNLTIKNSYYSTMYIDNGVIRSTSAGSQIAVDMPNGSAVFGADVIDEDLEDAFSVVDTSSVLNNALNYAVLKLQNACYDYESSLYSLVNIQKGACSLCASTNSNPCIYSSGDLEFLDHMYGYNIDYTYASGNTNIVSNNGNYVASGTTTITITATIGSTTASRTVNVHMLNSDENKAQAALSIALAHLQKYYADAVYTIGGQSQFPISNEYLGAEYDIEFYSSAEDSGLIESKSALFATIEGVSGYKMISLNSTVTHIKVVAKVSEQTVKSDFLPVSGNATSTITDKNTIANQIVSSLYGTQIVITQNDNGMNGYSYKDLRTEGYPEKQVTGLTYRIINNEADNAYSTDANKLHVNPLGTRINDPENIINSIFLEVSVVFDSSCTLPPAEKTTISVSVPIVYRGVSGDTPSGLSAFRPYYIQFNKWFNSAAGGDTYNSFEFRATVGNNYPIFYLTPTMYDSYGNEIQGVYKQGGATYKVINGKCNIGTEVIDIADVTTGTPQYTPVTDIIKCSFKSGSTENIRFENITLAQIESNNLKCVITIDRSYIPEEATRVEMLYHYKQFANSTVTTDGNFTSKFTMPGILRFGKDAKNQAERFTDEDLYKAIYDAYMDTYTIGTDTNVRYINTKFLVNELNEVSFKNVSNISSYKGIEVCKGIKKLDMTNSGVTIDDMQYIAQITKLENLILANNGLKDYINYSGNGFPNGTRVDFIGDYLSLLPNLKKLDVSQNLIANFAGLTKLQALKEVRVYNNTFTWTINIIITLNLSQSVNNIYGTNGAVNIGTYAQLAAKSVTIYNGATFDSDGNVLTETAYTGSTSVEVLAQNLANIEYQDRLEKGSDISVLWANLSIVASDYNGGKTESYMTDELKNSNDYKLKQAELDAMDKVVFGYVGDSATTATAFYIRYVYYVYYPTYAGSIWGSNINGKDSVEVYYEVQFDIERY